MNQEIVLRGMTCGHCVDRIASVLESNKEISEFHINLETGRVILISDTPVNLENLQAEISIVGNYQIELPYHENN